MVFYKQTLRLEVRLAWLVQDSGHLPIHQGLLNVVVILLELSLAKLSLRHEAGESWDVAMGGCEHEQVLGLLSLLLEIFDLLLSVLEVLLPNSITLPHSVLLFHFLAFLLHHFLCLFSIVLHQLRL